MGPIHEYLELHKVLRGTLLFTGFLVASVALYVVVALWLVGIPGASPNFFWDSVLPSSCLLVTLICGLGMGWILYRPGQRSLWSTFALVSGAIVVGTTLMSVAIWRGHWFELAKEILRSTGTMR